MEQIKNLIRLYEDQTITDVMDKNELEPLFISYGVSAYEEFLSLIPKNKKICVDDKEIEGLVNILNLLDCRTTASCSGHNETMAYIVFKVENMKDFECIHLVLTDFSEGQLQKFFCDRYQVFTLQSGIRIDIDCQTDELDKLGAWIFFCAIQDIILSLNWGWHSNEIKKLCRI